MSNPLTKPQYEDSERVLLPEGDHVFTLLHIKHLKDRWEKKDGTKADGLRFVFKSRDVEGAYTSRDVSTSTWAKRGNESGLVKLMLQMDIKGCRSCAMSEENIYDLDPFWDLVQKQVGKDFVIFVEPTDKYNNFSVLRPATGTEPKAAPAPEKPKTQSEAVTQAMGNDKMDF